MDSAAPTSLLRDGPERFDLLASAIAGRPVEVAAAEAGGLAWTDGVTVFVDVQTSAADQLASVAVQSALLGAGSLDHTEISRTLARRPGLSRRYLTIEGHRALTAQESLLPTSVGGFIDRAIAGRSNSPVDSLAIAASPRGGRGTARRLRRHPCEAAKSATREGSRRRSPATRPAPPRRTTRERARRRRRGSRRRRGPLLESDRGRVGARQVVEEALQRGTLHRGGPARCRLGDPLEPPRATGSPARRPSPPRRHLFRRTFPRILTEASPIPSGI